MIHYHVVRLFPPGKPLALAELDRWTAEGRRHFFVYCPRLLSLNDAPRLARWMDANPGVRFEFHDLNLVHPENEAALTRNAAFYCLLARWTPNLKSVSYHFRGLAGFGAEAQEALLASLLTASGGTMPADLFYRASYGAEEAQAHVDLCAPLFGDLVKTLGASGIEVLLKNTAYDYVITPGTASDAAASLERAGFRSEALSPARRIWPIPLEKGDFPRSVDGLLRLADETGAGVSLDMEFLRHASLASSAFHGGEGPWWDGLKVAKGAPVAYRAPLDPFEELMALRGRIRIAHLSASPGPVFLDGEDLAGDEFTDRALLGLVRDDLRSRAVHGRRPLGLLEGYEDTLLQPNFRSPAALEVWGRLFRRQFAEDLILLKDLQCPSVVLKLQAEHEKVTRTFELFDTLTELDLDPEAQAIALAGDLAGEEGGPS